MLYGGNDTFGVAPTLCGLVHGRFLLGRVLLFSRILQRLSFQAIPVMTGIALAFELRKFGKFGPNLVRRRVGGCM